MATLVLLLGALVVTGMIASGLQDKATAGHGVDGDFLPGGEGVDRQGWRTEPKAVRTDAARPDAGHPEKARSNPKPDGSDDDAL